MANQIIIDIGAAANDGTGDPLRTAFNYVNENFTSIWDTGVANSNVSFSGNRILTVNTNGNLVLAPNGTGKVQANVDIIPNANNTHSLGSGSLRWNTVYAQNLDVGGNVAFNNLTVNGNLTVDGDIIQVGNIVTDSKTIQLANTAGTDAAANGSGITVGANDDIATLLYNSANNVWTTNIGLISNGNITAPYISANIGIVSPGVDQDVIFNRNGVLSSAPGFNYNYPGNILYAPAAGFSGDLGVGVNGLFVGLGTFTPLGSDIVGQFTANVNAYSQINTQNISNGSAASGDYIITADNGTDSTHFVNLGITSSTWDGSQPNSLGNRLGPNDGYLYVQDGDLVIGTKNANSNIWKFDLAGNLTLPGNTFAVNYANGIPVSIGSDYGNANVADYLPTYSGRLTGNSVIVTQNSNIWMIDGQRLTAPSGGTWYSDLANNDEYITSGADGYVTILSLYANTSAASEIQLQHNQTKIIVRNGQDQEWNFGLDGDLTTPGDILPNTSNVYSLGSASRQWADLWVSNSTIYMNSVPITLGAGNVLTVNGEAVLTNDSNTTITTTGNITADYFFGSSLTGTSPSASVSLNAFSPDGNTVSIQAQGNTSSAVIEVFANAGPTTYNWTFDTTGNLNLPNGGSIIVDGGDGVIGPDGDNLVISWDNEDLILRSVGSDVDVEADRDFNIRVNYDGGANDYLTKWVFGQDNEIINITGNSAIITEAGNLNLQGGRNTLSSGNVQITAVNNGVAVNAWTFDNTGTLTAPGNIVMPAFSSLVGDGASPAPSISGFSNGGFGGNVSVTGNITGGNLSVTGNISGNTAGFAIGYRDIPQVSFTGNATIATTDAGKHFYSTQSSNYTLTIANNASQGFQVGAAITVVNQGTGTISIAQGSGVTLYLAGNASSGNRSVSTFGMATIMKVATDTWFINGTGVS